MEVKRKRKKKTPRRKAADGVNILKRHTNNRNNVYYKYEGLLSFHLVLFIEMLLLLQLITDIRRN